MENGMNNPKGINKIALIGIIAAVVVVIIVGAVLLLSPKKNSQKDNNTTNTQNTGEDEFLNEVEGNTVDDNKNEQKEYANNEGVEISELFDETGEDENKLHIGDFVDYTAGTWTKEQISKINANGKKKKPEEAYQFGGYTAKMSRDESVVPCNDDYDYVKEKIDDSDDEQNITGWRVFDITDDEIVLISAGCPEDYYHPEDGRSAYVSQYVLTGEVNSSINADWLGLGTDYKKRTWKEYVNSDYFATKATVLTKQDLDNWYSKYISENSDVWKNTVVQEVYETKYESLIDNYSYYWLASPYNASHIYGFFPIARAIGNSTNKFGNVFGIRILVHLPNDIKFKEESIGTKTIISRDNSYEYNIWEISR